MKILIKYIIFLGFVGVFISLTLPGCVKNTTARSTSAPVSPEVSQPTKTSETATNTPEKERKVTLIAGGYGYEVGDIVLMDTRKEPVPGDVVQYDWNKNKSSCMAFGSGVYLARIIGLPADNVSFQPAFYEVNGFKADFSNSQVGGSQRTLWGDEKFNATSDLFGKILKVPENEFLADKWIGQECLGMDENGSSIAYGRYTIKREAIIGIVIEKVGHDKKFEEEQKRVIY